MTEEKKQDDKVQQQSEQQAVDDTKRAEVQAAVEKHEHSHGQQKDYVERIDEKTSKH